MDNEKEFIAKLADQIIERIEWNFSDFLEQEDPEINWNETEEWGFIVDEIYFQLRNAYVTGRAMAKREGQSNG